MLGTVPDLQIAKLLGATSNVVKKERLKLGIQPYRIISWTPRMIARLGTVPDSKLVEPFGISLPSIIAKRREWGIPPYQKPQ